MCRGGRLCVGEVGCVWGRKLQLLNSHVVKGTQYAE